MAYFPASATSSGATLNEDCVRGLRSASSAASIANQRRSGRPLRYSDS